MATASEVLLIKIGADVVDLKKGIDDANKHLAGLNKSTQQAAAGMSSSLNNAFSSIIRRLAAVTAAALSARAVIGQFQAAIADTAAIGRLSQQTGIAVDRLSALKFAAEQAGVPFETLQQTIAQFSQRMGEAMANPTSTAAQALRALSVSVRDSQGSLRTFADVLPEFADRFASYRDGVDKARLASALFGEEAGPRLVPLLNQGRAGIERLMEEAKKLGIVLDQDAVKRAQDFQRAAGALQAALDGLVLELTRLAAPALTEIINKVVELIKQFNQMRQSMGDVAPSAAAAAGELITLSDKLATASIEQQRLNAMAGTWRALLPGYQSEVAKVDAEIARLTGRFRELSAVASDPTRTSSSEVFRPPAPVLDPLALEKAQFELDKLMERFAGVPVLMDGVSLAWETHADRVSMAVQKINAIHEEGFL